MKQEKLVKLIDVGAQLAAILLPWLFFVFIRHDEWSLEVNNLLVCYAIAGVVQVASTILNRYYASHLFRASGRGWFELLLLLLIAMYIITLMMKVVSLIIILLLYLTPLIVLWYLGISLTELILSTRNSKTEEA